MDKRDLLGMELFEERSWGRHLFAFLPRGRSENRYLSSLNAKYEVTARTGVA